ncbi:MFS-type transporter [Lachnellula subtilissima]|uniref:Efflux pump dotC n=1 Tax=Lachnellula subtilissima TaxID=602034 RepID=A0A8H8UHV7_9HELO|nr:MFS-type transporter [Lachnellula subtilissima]
MDKQIRNEAEPEAVAGPAHRDRDGDRGAIMEGQTEENIAAPEVSSSDETLNGSTASVNSVHETAAPAAKEEASGPEASRTSLQTAIIMISLCSSVFLAALDTTIVTTALPTISEYFHSNAGYTWIGSAYLLANAASTPSWGKISDIWGRKPILLVAAGIFFIGSVLCATSINIGMLIASRAIQGIGGGGLIVLVNICISDLFSMRNRGKYFGLVGMTWAFASAVGPILGGVFTEKVSWRWCFYINLPITGTVFILLCIFLHLDNPKTPVWDGLKAVDWLGSITIVGGTLMLLLGLEFGGVSFSWDSVTVICLIIFGVFVASLFVLNEWKFARYPIMPLRMFKHRSAIAALGTCFCHGIVFISGSYYLPLYFQAVIGATPLLSGVYTLAFALSLSFTSVATGIFIKVTGNYLPPIWFGMTILVLGWGLFIDLDSTANWPKIILFQIVAGIGVGPNFQAPLIALQNFVAPRDIATATATFGFVRSLATAIGVVIGSVVFQNEMQNQSASLVASLGPELADVLSGGSAGASVGIVTHLPPAQRVIARHAFFQSLRTMWIMFVAFAGFGLLVSLLITKRTLSKEHQVVKTGLAEEEAKRKEAKVNRGLSRDAKRGEKEAMKREGRKESGEVLPQEDV